MPVLAQDCDNMVFIFTTFVTKWSNLFIKAMKSMHRTDSP